MSAIPLHDLDQVATKGDLAVLSTELRSEIADLRTELKTDIAELRTGMRAELNAEIGALRKSMTNWMITLLVAIIGAMASITVIS